MRYLSAGESHGPALVGVIEGFPAGVPLDPAIIDEDLGRRLEGHGRGFRALRIEKDTVEFLAGMWEGTTLGSPIAMVVENTDHKVRRGRPIRNWRAPRPGHADFGGRIRYGYAGYAEVAERASARSTAIITAVGACARQLLCRFGVEIFSHVVSVGDVGAETADCDRDSLLAIRSGTPLRCLDGVAEPKMIAAVDAAGEAGTTLGGVCEVVAFGVPAGLGTYAHPDRRLDAALAADLMAVPSVKAVAIGDALAAARLRGGEAHDEILPDPGGRTGVRRETNRAGGLEGGVTNGMPLRLSCHAKPISTQREGLRSVDIETGEAVVADYVRSDVCVVPAVGVVAEAVVCWRLAVELVRTLGEAPLAEMLRRAAGTPGFSITKDDNLRDGQ